VFVRLFVEGFSNEEEASGGFFRRRDHCRRAVFGQGCGLGYDESGWERGQRSFPDQR